VMVLDPIFQGLAVALISGAIVATLLTMVVVPLLYWELRRRQTPDDAGHRDVRTVPAAAPYAETRTSPFEELSHV
jgi:hypothetical protein